MPTVPRIERNIQPTQIQGGQLSPAPAGAFKGLEKTQSTAEKMAVDIFAEATKRINDAIAVKTDYELSLATTDIDTAIRQKKGEAALNAPDEAMAAFEERTRAIQDSLNTDAQREMFAAKKAQYQKGLYNSANQHAITQFDQWNDDLRTSKADLTELRAVDSASDKKVYEANLAILKKEMYDQYPDAVIAEDKFQERKQRIEAKVRENDIRSRADEDRRKNLLDETANKELTDLQIADGLSYDEIQARRDSLSDSSYKTWVDRHERELEAIKKGEKIYDDQSLKSSYYEEAITMSPLATEEDVQAYKRKIADAVLERKLKVETARSLIGDAEKAVAMDSGRKASLNAVIAAFRADLKAGLLGDEEKGSLEYTRQLELLFEWVKKYPDKDPSEYYEKASQGYPAGGWSGLWGGTKQDYARRRLEMRGEMGGATPSAPLPAVPIDTSPARQKAIDMLAKANKPLTEANINAVMERYK